MNRTGRTRSANVSAAPSPGMSVNQNAARKVGSSPYPSSPGGFDHTSHAAISGPTTAPRVSPARWKPNALPRSAGSTASEMMALRSGPRTPLPSHASDFASSTSGQPTATAHSANATPVRAYPETTNAFRSPIRSEYQPTSSFAALETNSATASIAPRASPACPRDNPSTRRNGARSAVANS